MFNLFYTLILFAQPLENIKVELFERWSETNLFAMVSFGLPTQQESNEVEICLENLVTQLNIATGQLLSKEEREIELPFLSGMVAGLHLSQEGNADLCLKYLAGLDEAVFGFSSSKMWRIRLQAYVTLGDYKGADHAAQELRSLRDVSIEDQTVLALFEMSQLLADSETNVEEAVKRFVLHDQSLIDGKFFHLRDAFASGALKLMQSESGKKHMLISRLSQDLVLYPQHAMAREQLRSLNNRLKNPIQFLKNEEHPVIKNIALWNEIESHQLGSAERIVPLIKLALVGNHEASTELLSTFRPNPIIDEHIELLFDNAVVTNDKNISEYWILQRAIHCINNFKTDEGVEYLCLIPESSIYTEDSTRILRQIHELNVDLLIESLKQSAKNLEACSSLVESWKVATRLKVARELIDRSHAKPAPWQRNSIRAIIGESRGFPNHLSGELYRLIGESEYAAKHFKQAIEQDGETIEVLTGLADVTRNAQKMKRVVLATTDELQKSYWFWLANLRLIEWHLQDGGSKVDAIAKINRLRKMEASLGGIHFQHLFNELCEQLD